MKPTNVLSDGVRIDEETASASHHTTTVDSAVVGRSLSAQQWIISLLRTPQECLVVGRTYCLL